MQETSDWDALVNEALPTRLGSMPVNSVSQSEKPCASGQSRDLPTGKLFLWKCAAAGESGWLPAYLHNTSSPAAVRAEER